MFGAVHRAQDHPLAVTTFVSCCYENQCQIMVVGTNRLNQAFLTFLWRGRLPTMQA
jgi:hypothetical protein